MTERIRRILSVIPRCETLLDVGCDHGYIGLGALSQNKCSNVIFIDVSRPSLNKARANCPEEFLKRVSFEHCDGIGNLRGDVAVIAGMGGLEIISILTAAEVLPNVLVLQPMRNQIDVRQYLLKKYKIISDEKFKDGKFYDLIVARRDGTGEEYSRLQLVFGKTNLIAPSRDFYEFLLCEQTKLNNILQGCNDSNALSRLNDVRSVLAAIKEKIS